MQQTLTRQELTAALAARQGLLEPFELTPAAAVARLTPLQGQEPRAPYVALAARLRGFEKAAYDAAITGGEIVKTTIMRDTLHVAATSEYPVFAAFSRLAKMRAFRERYAHLDEERVIAELNAFLREPRSNDEIRAHMLRHDGIPDDHYRPILFARFLVHMVQVPPFGMMWDNRQRARFVVDPRPFVDPGKAVVLAIRRYLGAFGPASKRDVAGWAGVPQRDFAGAWDVVQTTSFRDEEGRELLDLPVQPLPPASTKLPPRYLGRWDQALLAHADRDRIIPPELLPLKLTHAGAQTLTVDGRVAASWKLEVAKDRARIVVEPHTDIARSKHAAIRAEGKRMIAVLAPEATAAEVAGLA
ncbi:MAG TPA: winged helix DNA-binding domain-containing protein [Solirubrobacteraceae bacterium]